VETRRLARPPRSKVAVGERRGVAVGAPGPAVAVEAIVGEGVGDFSPIRVGVSVNVAVG
jgi:hypothetical protein